MGAILGRIVVFLIGLAVASAAIVISFAFLCYALYALLATFFSPALAALVTAAGILLLAVLILAIVFAIVRPRKRKSDAIFTAGEVLGTIFSQRVRGLTAKSITASIVASLVAGFIVGARAGRRKKK